MDLNRQTLEARLHGGFGEIDPATWDALVASDHPFLAHAFLHGLEQHGCIRKELGWQSCPLGLYRNGRLLAAAPLYLKDNSHGEFVFDWAWASSYARLGMDYYPKLLAAVRGGVKIALIPEENVKDLTEIPDNIKNKIEIVPVKWIDQVLERALERKPEALPEQAGENAGAATVAENTPSQVLLTH